MSSKRDERPRDRNKYAGGCPDCGAWVNPGEGFLYRHSGANLKRMSRGRSRFVYVVRCQGCGVKHDGDGGRADVTTKTEAGEWSGVTYTGYGQNSHAPCGN